jgi:predicted transcriptional regulator
MTTAKFWLGSQLIDAEEYRRREAALSERVYRLSLTQTWIARQIGSAQSAVSAVLNGKDAVPRRASTLLIRIEHVVAQVERGELSPYDAEPVAEAA